jgi:hypothetical protein
MQLVYGIAGKTSGSDLVKLPVMGDRRNLPGMSVLKAEVGCGDVGLASEVALSYRPY